MGVTWTRWAGRVAAAGVVALLAIACGGAGSTEGEDTVPAALAGTWELTMVSTNATGPQQATRDTYDAVLSIDEDRGTFQITEWRSGAQKTSSGMVIVDGDELKLIHTEDYETATRVDDAVWSVKDGRLAMAVGERDWTVYYYDRP